MPAPSKIPKFRFSNSFFSIETQWDHSDFFSSKNIRLLRTSAFISDFFCNFSSYIYYVIVRHFVRMSWNTFDHPKTAGLNQSWKKYLQFRCPNWKKKSWIVSSRDSRRHSSKDVHSICIPIHNKPNSDTDCYCCHLSYPSQWRQIINEIAFKSINYKVSQDVMSGFWYWSFRKYVFFICRRVTCNSYATLKMVWSHNWEYVDFFVRLSIFYRVYFGLFGKTLLLSGKVRNF